MIPTFAYYDVGTSIHCSTNHLSDTTATAWSAPTCTTHPCTDASTHNYTSTAGTSSEGGRRVTSEGGCRATSEGDAYRYTHSITAHPTSRR